MRNILHPHLAPTDANHRASMSLLTASLFPELPSTSSSREAKGSGTRLKYSGTAVLACRWGQPAWRGGKYCKRGNRQDAAHRESRRRIEGASEFTELALPLAVSTRTSLRVKNSARRFSLLPSRASVSLVSRPCSLLSIKPHSSHDHISSDRNTAASSSQSTMENYRPRTIILAC